MENITIIGSSHIAKQSMKEVEDYIKNKKPDMVALELDPNRLYALLHNSKQNLSLSMMFKVGVKGYLFAIIGSWASRKLGSTVGVMPGSEMKKAFYLAKKNKIKVMLIDQDIQITLRRFSNAITWKEKWRIAKDVIKGVFFKKSAMKDLGVENLDLTKVPEEKLLKTIISKMKEDYPNIYRVLVHERNIVMAKNLKNIANLNPGKKILAIVGAGHKEGMENILNAEPISYSYTVTT